MKSLKKESIFLSVFYALIFSIISNSYAFVWGNSSRIIIFASVFSFCNLFAGVLSRKAVGFRLKICYHGCILLSSFVTSALISVIYQISYGIACGNWKEFLFSAIFFIVAEAIIFWCGIISVYVASYQLGIKHRALGIICGLIPILNLVMLRKIIKTVYAEISLEYEKSCLNKARKKERVCETKYPILLVHGVFFRDFKFFNYWGRIPRELKINGAKIYYGNHESASSVEESAKELSNRIKEIIKKTGAKKINVIAHSKGGLDCRWAISHNGIGKYIASLTTINTPHQGCQFAEYLLETMPEETKETIASTYNKALLKLGDSNPDFLAAVYDLTASQKFDDTPELFENIYCQSVGSILNKAKGGKFPLNFSYHLVKHFDGKNDGLVSESSFPWGEKYTLLTPKGKYGISHGDMIDLHRINVEGFDVREFYVDLVSDLKNRGL